MSCEKQRKRLVYAIYDQCGVEQFNKLKRLLKTSVHGLLVLRHNALISSLDFLALLCC